jgi:RND family efflux transporter MFP subunit
MKVAWDMKKIVIAALIALPIAVTFFVGARYGKGQSAVNASSQVEPVHADVNEGQENSDASLSPGAVKISPARQQLIGMKVAAVEKKPMTYALRLYGRVVPDETKNYRVNASTDSWIRELSEVTTGSIVSKNQILAEALSPAYYNAQVTFLIALDNIDRINRQLGGQLRHQQADLANNQIRIAVQALQNLGITDAQTEELANTRKARPYLQVRAPTQGVVLSRNITLKQWFKAGEEFYTIADLGRVWVYADVYEDEAMHMRPGMNVKVRHAQMGKSFRASVGEVLPLFDPVARTLKVRVDIENPQYDLRPDMFVDVEIPISMPPSLNVPGEAILDTGTRAIVYVDVGNGSFEPRIVETGWRLGGRVEITGGLSPGEKVAVSGNFLIDSESRMEIAALGSGVRMSVDPVCGRYVDEEEAEMLERTATYENETFYFSSEQSKSEFEKDPEKYFRKGQKDVKEEDRAGSSGTTRTWADLLDPIKASQAIEEAGKESSKAPKDTLGDSESRVIDWNGPEKEGAPPRDWSGWGKFPGAEYLGLKHRYKRQETGDKDGIQEPTDQNSEDRRQEPEAKR